MPGLLLIPALVFFGLTIYLNSSGPLWFIICIELPLLTALLLRYSQRREKLLWSRILSVAAALQLTLLTAGFLVFILILPETLYQGWLLLLAAGKPAGTISFIFVYAASLASGLGVLMLLFWKDRIQALLNLCLLCSLVALILYPLIPVFLVFITLLIFKIIRGLQSSGPFRAMGLVRVLSLALVFLPALIAGTVPVKESLPRGSGFINALSSGLQHSLAAFLPGLPVHLQIPGYGYSYERGRDTGERPLLTEQAVFTVRGTPGDVFYLRSDVFYRYGEGGWKPADPGSPEVGLDKNPGRALLRSLTLETDLYTRVPLSPDTGVFRRDGLFYSTGGAGSLEVPGGLPLVRGETIYFYRRSPENISPDSSDEQILFGQIRSARSLPQISPRLEELALSLEGDSPAESLDNIRHYLAAGYSYTLDTEASGSLADDFLFATREGYCVHFSTSAALLARVLDIPVRIAEGFLVQIPPARYDRPETLDGTHRVTGFAAHQWPEIYREGTGWIPWEVTPPFESAGASSLEYDDLTGHQLQSMGVLDLQEEGKAHETRRRDFIGLISMVLFFLAGGGAAAALVQRRSIKLVLKGKIRRGTKRFSIESPDRTGWLYWLDRAEKNNPLIGEEGHRLLLRYLYSGRELDRKERKDLLRRVRKIL